MSLDYIRRTYKVPAKRGMRVRVNGKSGVIIGGTANLKVRFDEPMKGATGRKFRIAACHPLWMIEYESTSVCSFCGGTFDRIRITDNGDKACEACWGNLERLV